MSQDLLPEEKRDEFILRDYKGKMLANLKRFKYLLKTSTSIESVAKKLDTSSRNVEHFIKLYNFRNLPKKEKILPEGENREDYITNEKGGTFKREYIRDEKSGYRRKVYSDENNKRKSKLEHREVVEKNIGRALTEKEVVHHINGKRSDNAIDNLYVCDGYEEHAEIHRGLDEISYELLQLGIIKFVEGGYCLEETFFDDLERYNMNKKVFNENLEYYRGEQLKHDL